MHDGKLFHVFISLWGAVWNKTWAEVILFGHDFLVCTPLVLK